MASPATPKTPNSRGSPLGARDPAKNNLIVRISKLLQDRPIAEIQNILRMVHNKTLQPANAPEHGMLSHYPRPDHATQLWRSLNACYGTLARKELAQMPELARMVRDELEGELMLCIACEGLIDNGELQLTQAKLIKWRESEKELSEGGSIYDQGFKHPTPSASPAATKEEEEQRAAWELFGEYCKVQILVSFIRTQVQFLIEEKPSEPTQACVLSTDSAHKAMGLLHDDTTEMMREDDPDWIRLKGSGSLRVQGHLIQGDLNPQELMYDIACKLGMPQDGDMKGQNVWMEQRASALVWITRMVRQGCFASLMYIIGTAFFGDNFFNRMSGPSTNAGGHKLEIDAFPSKEGQGSELRVAASVLLGVRDTSEDMELIGEIPLDITVHVMLDEAGTVAGFQMSANVELTKDLVNWEMLRTRVAPILHA